MSDPSSDTMAEFDRLDIRVGTITDAQPAPQAQPAAIQLWLDFGPGLGIRRSSARITRHYTPDQLIGRQVMAVVNLPTRQVGTVASEVLVLGVPDEAGDAVLLRPDFPVSPGARMA